MKRIAIFLIVSFLCLSVQAAVRVTAQAPGVVAVGEQFQLQYTVNSQSAGQPRLGAIAGFDVLYGPATSTSYSFQSINGRQSQNSTTTFSYTLMAKKKGTFTLPSITLSVEGRQYRSNAVSVKVVAGSGGSQQSNARQQVSANPSPVRENNSGRLTNKDLFIAVTANKSQVYEQEPVVLTYRVYTKVNLTQLGGKMPDLKGFMVKEIPLPQQKSFSVGSFHGENYYTTVWSQYVMFPQQTGKLVVPNIKFDGIVTISNPNIDMIDAFFNGSAGSIRKEKTIIAPSLAINVLPLPAKPANFSGGVGSFTIKAVAKNPQLKENETLDLQVIVSGTGNVDLIKAPTVNFPSGFDTYDPKMTNNTKLSAGNMNGNLVIDYLAVPKNKGEYTIPPIELCYFDTQSKSYRTIRTQPLEIKVAKGEKNIYSDKQQEILARSDIRFIKTGNVHFGHKSDVMWNTLVYWLLYLAVLVAAAMAFYLVDLRVSLNGNVGLKRYHGAGRLATGRLKKARQLAGSGQTDAFYEEMLHALNGYAGDKLGIPVSDLSQESLRSELAQANVSDELSAQFTDLLDRCQFLRYSGGGDTNARMEDIYGEGLKIISALDAVIKKKKK